MKPHQSKKREKVKQSFQNLLKTQNSLSNTMIVGQLKGFGELSMEDTINSAKTTGRYKIEQDWAEDDLSYDGALDKLSKLQQNVQELRQLHSEQIDGINKELNEGSSLEDELLQSPTIQKLSFASTQPTQGRAWEGDYTTDYYDMNSSEKKQMTRREVILVERCQALEVKVEQLTQDQKQLVKDFQLKQTQSIQQSKYQDLLEQNLRSITEQLDQSKLDLHIANENQKEQLELIKLLEFQKSELQESSEEALQQIRLLQKESKEAKEKFSQQQDYVYRLTLDRDNHKLEVEACQVKISEMEKSIWNYQFIQDQLDCKALQEQSKSLIHSNTLSTILKRIKTQSPPKKQLKLSTSFSSTLDMFSGVTAILTPQGQHVRLQQPNLTFIDQKIKIVTLDQQLPLSQRILSDEQFNDELEKNNVPTVSADQCSPNKGKSHLKSPKARSASNNSLNNSYYSSPRTPNEPLNNNDDSMISSHSRNSSFSLPTRIKRANQSLVKRASDCSQENLREELNLSTSKGGISYEGISLYEASDQKADSHPRFILNSIKKTEDIAQFYNRESLKTPMWKDVQADFSEEKFIDANFKLIDIQQQLNACNQMVQTNKLSIRSFSTQTDPIIEDAPSPVVKWDEGTQCYPIETQTKQVEWEFFGNQGQKPGQDGMVQLNVDYLNDQDCEDDQAYNDTQQRTSEEGEQDLSNGTIHKLYKSKKRQYHRYSASANGIGISQATDGVTSEGHEGCIDKCSIF